MIYDPAQICAELEKPINLDKEARRSYGLPATGAETPATYTLRDKWAITAELDRLYEGLTKGLVPSKEQKTFYLTAGGPGSGKTRLIGALQANGTLPRSAVHVDPDDVVLKQFRPYNRMIGDLADSDIGRTIAYTYWRWASIFIANSIVNKLANDGHDIILGTTGTSPHIVNVYDAAKAAGYKTHVVICHAPESVRLAGAKARFEAERRYIPLEDVKEKGNVMFPAMAAAHLRMADSADIYWRAAEDSAPALISSRRDGNMTIHDREGYAAFLDEVALTIAEPFKQELAAGLSVHKTPAP